MVVSQIIRRVFYVKYGEQTGTIFSIDYEGRQYLVSAKHIFEGAGGEFDLEIFHDNGWKRLSVKLTGHSQLGDISVMSAQNLLTSSELKAEPSSADMQYGQDVYFLGFPLGLFGDFLEVNSGYPLPFVKKATLSMPNSLKSNVIYLDGINNVGFSGGPVAFSVAGKPDVWRIAGVVSGYLAHQEVVTHQNADIGLRYEANTGLIEATPIKCALDVIKANPNGIAH
jgi:S1-C subfamily serine protease